MKMLFLMGLVGLCLTLLHADIQVKNDQNQSVMRLPSQTRQLLVVTTPDWNTKEGILQRYARDDVNRSWSKVGEPISVVLGRNGLGWGLGLHTVPYDAQHIKQEGDGRSPAGLFSLGHGFGYNDLSIAFPYQTYRRTDHCVDDSHSRWYNQIVDSTKVTRDYNSFEHMRLRNNLYEYGITVNHNPEQIPQAGSCIFIHIRSHSGKGTAGCTAMQRDKLLEILSWLREDHYPLLLQLPKGALEKWIRPLFEESHFVQKGFNVQ